MAYLSAEETADERRKFEKKAAEALAGLAHVLMIDYLRGWNNATNINILVAEQAVQKACALDPSVALAHVTKGQIREVEGDLKGAIDALNEALALDPELAIAHAHKANAHILLGEAEKAPKLLKEAIERAKEAKRAEETSEPKAISSRDPELGLFYWFMGRAYFNTAAYFNRPDDYYKAIDYLKKSVDLRRTTWFSRAHLISAYALTDQLREAKKTLDDYRSFKANWPPLDKIRDYYAQPKYRNRHPQLDAALREYFNGLEKAEKFADSP